jgi:regulator of cell morphogenesis and NO signaling
MGHDLKYKTLADLLAEHYLFAYILHYYGIECFEHQTKTLAEICDEQEISLELLEKQYMELLERRQEEPSVDTILSLPLIISYLQAGHALLLEKRFPFIRALLQRLDANGTGQHLMRELLERYLVFTEEYTQHIMEEEGQVFTQVMSLYPYADRPLADPYQVYCLLNNLSIADCALSHADEQLYIMDELLALVHDLSLLPIDSVQIKVLADELQALAQALRIHAALENEWLFPLAMALERRAKAKLKDVSILN